MKRRTFLAAAAALAQRGSALGANDEIQLAVVGAGGRGRGHIEYYNDIPGVRVAAVCDVNQAARERAEALVLKLTDRKPRLFTDLRKLYDDPEINAVSIATPNHWHALATIWACQAGKDVYVEKPAAHDPYEAGQMVAAARKYKRVVQVGSQSRSIAHKRRAIELLGEGVIGAVYMARGLCYRRRNSIGHTPVEPVPPGLDWDIFLGPAPMREYTKNRFAYNWHWFWDTGNGDIGNQGVHEMDICRWGLGVDSAPSSASSTGGKFIWKDDQETPNMQQAAFGYGDREIVFDVRNLNTGGESQIPLGKSLVGNIFYGSEGYMSLHPEGFQVYLGDERQVHLDEKHQEERIWDPRPHMANFLDAARSKDPSKLNADIALGAAAADLCHYANASYRLERRLQIDPASGRAEDAEAKRMLRREGREPWRIPDPV